MAVTVGVGRAWPGGKKMGHELPWYACNLPCTHPEFRDARQTARPPSREDGIDEDSEVGCTRLFDGVASTAEKKSTGSLCKDSKCKDQLRRFGANLIQRAAWQRGLETLGLCKSVGSEYLRSPLLGVCKTPHTTRSIGAGVRFTHNQLAPSLIIWEYLGTFSLNHFNQSTQWSVGKVCFTKHFSAFAAKAGVLLRLPQLSVATASGLSCP